MNEESLKKIKKYKHRQVRQAQEYLELEKEDKQLDYEQFEYWLSIVKYSVPILEELDKTKERIWNEKTNYLNLSTAECFQLLQMLNLRQINSITEEDKK